MSRSKNTHIREVWQDRLFHIFNQILFAIILFIVIYPLYFIVIASFSDPSAVLNGEVVFWPKDVSLIGYSAIMEYTRIWRGYMWSIIYTVVGTALSVTLTMLLAYALSCQFVGKKLINWLVVFTMFFSGGLIPTFLTMKNLGLYNRPLIMILMGAISVWNTMIARTFIQTSLPQGLYEAAQIDGASHARYFFQMVLPLSSTIIAVLCVYYAVGRWNDYFTALIYLKNTEYWPLQTVLRQILATLTISGSDYAEALGDDFANASEAQRIANSVKYCSIIISTVPAVVLYIFLQDYFVKGVMIGSIKG
ncbi:MAG: carbohydrate ABC transporter permease [Clostridiales bacterium]|nr:carbohydrate ABC transporter permease [Clostridiales bacterium]MDY4199741.1 carbohydrate ABC transporter permease [Candidatus Fimadaptatus sp.]